MVHFNKRNNTISHRAISRSRGKRKKEKNSSLPDNNIDIQRFDT